MLTTERTGVKGKKSYAKIVMTAVIALFMVAVVLIGPLDCFTHGYYFAHLDDFQIDAEDFYQDVALDAEGISQSFIPQKDHFAGVGIYFTSVLRSDPGKVVVEVYDENNQPVDSAEVKVSDISARSLTSEIFGTSSSDEPLTAWYRFSFHENYEKGKTYSFKIMAEGCEVSPHISMINPDYLGDEMADDAESAVFSEFAYEKSTFSFCEKCIFLIFGMSLLLFIYSCLFDQRKRQVRIVSLYLLLTGMLTWTFQFNSMDNANDTFEEFQADSETLVMGMIWAEDAEVGFTQPEYYHYHLGRYYDMAGARYNYKIDNYTGEGWTDGYSLSEPQVCIPSSVYSREMAAVGNLIRFDNGESFRITEVSDDYSDIVITLESDGPLNPHKYGDLADAVFLNADGSDLPKGQINAYRSQYGLHGRVFRHLARWVEDPDEVLPRLNLLCSFLTAATLILLVFLIRKHCNLMLAVIFFVTFWLSPWVVNYGRNLFWVEFTWFAPMAVGLFCTEYVRERGKRIFCYLAAFSAILFKSLCGYEFMTVVMMGLIAFPLIDLGMSLYQKDKDRSKLLFRTVLILGLCALAGFFAAICVHAQIKGAGNLALGIKVIFKEDVLRRAGGASLNNVSSSFWASINASVWETICKYFHFSTEIVMGITGNFFPLLCIIPLFIFGWDWKNGRKEIQDLVMYVVFFCVSMSWFVLGKSHSYIHTHMNYVLWYFGFVQVCFYVIVKRLSDWIKRKI